VSNPLPGEFRCGDCVTLKRHAELVDAAVDGIWNTLLTYALSASTEARIAIHDAAAALRR
jgi:hypothetical protein